MDEPIRVSIESPFSAVAASLFEELAVFYEERYDEPGFGAFPVEQLASPRSLFVVAWRGNDAVGCGGLRPLEESLCAEVKRMFVRQEARRQGVAQAILAALELHARRLGYDRIRLETGTLVPEAVRLYDAAGYRRMPCWGAYATREESVCFERSL